ncbi:hypothetical protein EYF80_012848 [Liparis tanakae]|uniref:Uncharacterized protein n=1 Tax=Liparis tanakae TaxID=230148 RepID=A0A4Z2II53_9TELE|nr:hypothetical protein EYF80_012848 [Liparis tanakae]
MGVGVMGVGVMGVGVMGVEVLIQALWPSGFLTPPFHPDQAGLRGRLLCAWQEAARAGPLTEFGLGCCLFAASLICICREDDKQDRLRCGRGEGHQRHGGLSLGSRHLVATRVDGSAVGGPHRGHSGDVLILQLDQGTVSTMRNWQESTGGVAKARDGEWNRSQCRSSGMKSLKRSRLLGGSRAIPAPTTTRSAPGSCPIAAQLGLIQQGEDGDSCNSLRHCGVLGSSCT